MRSHDSSNIYNSHQDSWLCTAGEPIKLTHTLSLAIMYIHNRIDDNKTIVGEQKTEKLLLHNMVFIILSQFLFCHHSPVHHPAWVPLEWSSTLIRHLGVHAAIPSAVSHQVLASVYGFVFKQANSLTKLEAISATIKPRGGVDVCVCRSVLDGRGLLSKRKYSV